MTYYIDLDKNLYEQVKQIKTKSYNIKIIVKKLGSFYPLII